MINRLIKQGLIFYFIIQFKYEIQKKMKQSLFQPTKVFNQINLLSQKEKEKRDHYISLIQYDDQDRNVITKVGKNIKEYRCQIIDSLMLMEDEDKRENLLLNLHSLSIVPSTNESTLIYQAHITTLLKKVRQEIEKQKKVFPFLSISQSQNQKQKEESLKKKNQSKGQDQPSKGTNSLSKHHSSSMSHSMKRIIDVFTPNFHSTKKQLISFQFSQLHTTSVRKESITDHSQEKQPLISTNQSEQNTIRQPHNKLKYSFIRPQKDCYQGKEKEN